MKANYNSYCPLCPKGIKRGERIMPHPACSDDDRVWVHMRCGLLWKEKRAALLAKQEKEAKNTVKFTQLDLF